MPTGHYRFRRSLGNVSSNFRGARPDTYPLLSYVLQNRALDLSNVGSLTISDLSGNGNIGTLYTGIYVSTNGTTDKAIVADASAAGSGNYYLTGKIKPNGTTQAKATIDGSALNLSGLTADVWQDFTTTTKTGVTPDTVAVGWNGGGNYSAADWSDVRLINASDNSVVAHWKLYDSAAASLGGYPALDCVGGYHGAHVGCAGGSGEGVDADVASISATLDDKMFFDGVSYVSVAGMSAAINYFGSCTISANIYVSTTDSFMVAWALGNNCYRLYTNAGNWFVNNNGDTAVAVTAGTHTVSVTYDVSGNAISFTLDGSEVWTGSVAGGTSAAIFYVGSRLGAFVWDGLIYDFELSGSSVKNFAFDGDELATWTDTTGGGNNGTVNGSPVTVGQKRETILQTAGEDFNKRMWFDGVNDYVEWPIVRAGKTDIDIHAKVLVSPNSNGFVLFSGSNGGLFIGIGQEGSASTGISTAGGTITVDGITMATRGDVYTALTDGEVHDFVATGVNITSFASDQMRFGFWSSASLYMEGIASDIIIYDSDGTTKLHEWQGYGNTNADWVDLVGSVNGTVNGSPSLYHVAESETTAGQDALGNAITNPRPNERVANLSATDAQVTITDNASLDSLNVWAQWFYFDGTNGDIIDFSNGAGTTTIEVTTGALASTGLTSPTYYVGNKTTAMANTTTLSAGWNYIAVTFTDFTPTADLLALRTGGHFIAYNEPKVLADLEKNRAATKGQY